VPQLPAQWRRAPRGLRASAPSVLSAPRIANTMTSAVVLALPRTALSEDELF